MSEFERKCQDLDNEARKSSMGLGDVPDISPAPLKPHSSCLNTPFSSQYIWTFTIHSAILSFIASSLPCWELPVDSWSLSACVSVALPQGPDAHLTPTWIAVDTSSDFIFLLWACGTCHQRLKSQLVHLCSARTNDGRFQKDFDSWASKDEGQRAWIVSSMLRSLMIVLFLSQYVGKWPARRRCAFYFHSVIKHLRNFWQRTSCRRS